MMKIVITGAGGFLGREIVEHINKSEGYEIIALTSQTKSFELQYGRYNNIQIIDYMNYMQIDFSKIDFLISCAFPTKTEDNIAMAKGLEYVCSLLNYANTMGVKHIIDISTQSVYGTQRSYKAYETSKINLDTKYAVGKYYTELMLDNICKNCSLIHYRIASLIGVNFEQRITNIFVSKLVQGFPLHVIDGNQIMGYMDVRDAANAIVLSLPQLTAARGREIYNISAGAYSLFDIANTVIETGKEYNIVPKPMICEATGKFRDTSVDSEKFQSIFNWKARYALEDTIHDIFESKISTYSK